MERKSGRRALASFYNSSYVLENKLILLKGAEHFAAFSRAFLSVFVSSWTHDVCPSHLQWHAPAKLGEQHTMDLATDLRLDSAVYLQ